jgi:hypothetical protein
MQVHARTTGACATVAAVVTDAQAERLRACARVLKAPARIVLTGDIARGATQALSAGAAPGVEVIALAPDEIARLDGPIDVLFIGPARRFSLAVDLFERWPGRVVPGGTLFVHGAFATPPLTAALLRTLARVALLRPRGGARRVLSRRPQPRRARARRNRAGRATAVVRASGRTAPDAGSQLRSV